MGLKSLPEISTKNGDVPLVSVVIPIYQRTEWISLCLCALEKQSSNQQFEIVIVDDGSPSQQNIADAIVSALKDLHLTVRFFRKVNGGPAAARNYGVSESRGTIICFLDDDSIVGENWIEEIVSTFSDKTVSVVSGKIASFNRSNPFPLLLEEAVYTGVHWATCNIAYRRELFERLGGFDERFREASWEDNDLGLRARWNGARQVYNKNAIVFHSHEETYDEYFKKCLVNGRGAAAFTRKYFSIKPLWALAVPIVMSRYLLLLLSPAVITQSLSVSYLRFLWSLNSLRGFLGAIIGNTRGTNQKG